MLNSTLPFSKARARCCAGTPVRESYLRGGPGWVELRGAEPGLSERGCRQGTPLPPREDSRAQGPLPAPSPTSGRAAPGSGQG